VTERLAFPHNEALYRRIVEDSPAAVVLLTNEPAAAVLYASPRIEEISGYRPVELVAHPTLWMSRLHPDEVADVQARWATAVENRERFQAEYRFLHRDGGWRWLRETSSPVRDEDGHVRYRQSFTEDVTTERFAEAQAERSEARYRALVERLPVIVYVDSDELSPRSLYVSPNSSEILGYRPGDYLADPQLWFDSMHPDDLPRVREAWEASIRTRQAFNAEYRDLKPDGTVVWVRDHSLLVYDDGGEPLFWQGVLFDITAEKRAESALIDSERRYRALVEQLPAAVYIDERRGQTSSVFVSQQIQQMTGIPADRWITEAGLWEQVIHPDDHERVRTAMEHAAETLSNVDLEYRWLHRDGRVVWVHDVAGPVLGDDGRVLYWLGVMTDITAHKGAEFELARSETRYRALVEQIPAIVYEMGPDDERRTLFVSHHVEEVLGYPRQEWLDQPDIWTELLHDEDRERELAANDLHNETAAPWHREYRLVASDGRTVWVSDRGELVIGAEGPRWLGVMLDITPQKEAEEILRLANDELEMRVLTRTAELEEANEMMGLESGERRRIEQELRDAEQRYRQLLEDLPVAAYSWEANWQDDPAPADLEFYSSPKLEEILGFPRSEWHRPGFWQERLHPHDRERILPLAERSLETGEPFNAEYRYLAADGRVVWVLDRATLRKRDSRGRPRLFQGVMIDVTDRKRAEAEAEAAEERFRRFADEGPVFVYDYEVEHTDPPTLHMRYMSPSAADLLGSPISAWKGNLDAWLAMMHPDDVERMTSIAREALLTGNPWNHTFRMLAADGRVVWLLDRGRAIERDEMGRPHVVQGVLIDVTDEWEKHAELEASEATLRALIETMPAVPWSEVVDAATGMSRYRLIGPQVEEVFGYTPDELYVERDHFFRLVHPDDRERMMAASDRCDRTGEPWDEIYRVEHRDGSVHWIFSYAKRTFENGHPVWHGIAVDVTAHVASERFPVRIDQARKPDLA